MIRFILAIYLVAVLLHWGGGVPAQFAVPLAVGFVAAGFVIRIRAER